MPKRFKGNVDTHRFANNQRPLELKSPSCIQKQKGTPLRVAALREIKNVIKPLGKAEPKESPIKKSYAQPPNLQVLEERQENDNSSQWTLEE